MCVVLCLWIQKILLWSDGETEPVSFASVLRSWSAQWSICPMQTRRCFTLPIYVFFSLWTGYWQDWGIKFFNFSLHIVSSYMILYPLGFELVFSYIWYLINYLFLCARIGHKVKLLAKTPKPSIDDVLFSKKYCVDKNAFHCKRGLEISRFILSVEWSFAAMV